MLDADICSAPASASSKENDVVACILSPELCSGKIVGLWEEASYYSGLAPFFPRLARMRFDVIKNMIIGTIIWIPMINRGREAPSFSGGPGPRFCNIIESFDQHS